MRIMVISKIYRENCNVDEIFERYTNYKITEFGHEINCIKGLWGVTAPTKAQAESEAQHYFWLYFGDGEYDEQR